MIYYSQLILDMRPQARGHLLLKNVYTLHQRLWMAFPDVTQEVNESAPFMFRVEPGRPIQILVQSSIEPDWQRAFHNAPGYIDTDRLKVILRSFDGIEQLQTCRFRLLANPVCTKHKSDDPEDNRRFRRPISDSQQLWNWLDRQLKHIAEVRPQQADFFGLEMDGPPVPPQRILVGRKPGKTDEIQIVARLFEGTLHVRDPEKLKQTMSKGIGRAKAFGCGLLSVAPAT